MATTETPNEVDATMPPPIPDAEPEQFEPPPVALEDAETVPEGRKVVVAKPAKREPRAPGERNPLAGAENDEHQSWRDYFASLAGSSPFRIEVHRKKPETIRYKNRNIDCNGHLASYEELIDEEYIRERHGGGTFLLRFMIPNSKGGGYKYGGAKQIKIAGDPKIEDKWLNTDDAPATTPPTGLDPAAKRLTDILEKENERKDRKLEDLANRSALDPTLIALITEPLKQQNAMLAAELREMRAELTSARNAPVKETKGDEFRDKILDKMLDTENARLTAMKANHESELRQIKEGHVADMKRLEDRHDRALSDLRAQHERELSHAKTMQDIALASVNQGSNLAKGLLEQTISRLEGENRRLEKEVDELRAKKEKSIPEQLKDIEAIKKLVGGDKGDEEEEKKSGWVQAIEALGVGQIAQAAAGKLLAGADPAQQQQAQQQVALPPPGTRFRGPDGHAYLMTPAGPRRLKPRQVAAPAAPQMRTEMVVNPETGEPQEVQVPVEPTPPAVVIPPDKLALVKNMLEGAYNAGTDPAAVAQTAKTMAPGAIPAITQAIGTQGVDAFLDQMAAFDGNSPLAQQSGRNFLRKVAKALMGE